MKERLEQNIVTVVNTEIGNQAVDDMIDEFGYFVAYCLFWMSKYDKWYDNRVRQLNAELTQTTGKLEGRK